jgi:hypothetical protein
MKTIIAFFLFSIGLANATTYIFENSLCKTEFNTFTKKFSIDKSCFTYFSQFDLECSISQETAVELIMKASKCLDQNVSCMESIANSTSTVRIRISKEDGEKIINAISSSGKKLSNYTFSDFSKDINNGIFGNGTNCWLNYMFPIKEK